MEGTKYRKELVANKHTGKEISEAIRKIVKEIGVEKASTEEETMVINCYGSPVHSYII